MPRYAITEKAGRMVAGTNNIGVGAVLNLTEKQAAHELRLGSLRLLDVQAAGDMPKAKPTEPSVQTDPVDDLADLTVAELKALAEEEAIELDSDLRKAEIIDAIQAARASAA